MHTDSAFNDAAQPLSRTLATLIDGIEGDTVTLRQLMHAVGEQGLLLICALASLPFLIPVSIPGVSTVFGAAIILIGIAVFLNRLPWLPARILDKELDTARLVPTLRKGVGVVSRVDKYIKPRFASFTGSIFANRINALAIAAGGLLLMFPLGLIPFSNTLPGIAILLTALGMLQRDGAVVICGYIFLALTTFYFGALGFVALRAGNGLASMLG
ncbi:exopolysaccharide biosynthesis protein [Rhizobium lemnae]|uniref:Exopolysaccharide biosynthesis protein n=1 Tax=Rhizobium lemnae TaxID=1214924 RepID=A0ABV8EAZ1_9HYPH|nr:exopolysaccharide biosynthesis protein [Rhizobium lemnae]MCJ8506988.1 exopolysaccharide biosynthesis protein [Rhizobium lemnae]